MKRDTAIILGTAIVYILCCAVGAVFSAPPVVIKRGVTITRPESVAPSVPVVAPKEACVRHRPVVSRARQTTRILFFTAKWCGHCRPTKTALESLKASGWTMGDDETYQIQVVDFDRQKDLAQRFGVTNLPCLVGLVGDKEHKRRVGSLTDTWAISELVGIAKPVNKGRQLRSNYRDAAVMRAHLIADHGIKPERLEGKTYEEMLAIHDLEHGEVLR